MHKQSGDSIDVTPLVSGTNGAGTKLHIVIDTGPWDHRYIAMLYPFPLVVLNEAFRTR
jgi:hypothetical protein